MLNFTYMEINPIVFTADGKIVPLDLAAKIDETAAFLNASQWGHLDFHSVERNSQRRPIFENWIRKREHRSN
jgi:succinyl-CoA synthetase beta subunit